MSIMTNKAVGQRLRDLRKAKGLGTQANLAQILGVITNTYNSWETGQTLLPVDMAVQICALTGATLDYIYRGDLSSLTGNLITLLSSLDRKKA